MVSFYNEIERKKEHLITVISIDKWYYITIAKAILQKISL